MARGLGTQDRLKRSGKEGIPFRTTAVQNDPTWRTTQFNSLLSCWMQIAEEKESLRATRYDTRDELINSLGRSIPNINKDGRVDGVRRIPNIWRKVTNKEATILKAYKCCTCVNNALSEISNSCHYLLSTLVTRYRGDSGPRFLISSCNSYSSPLSMKVCNIISVTPCMNVGNIKL